jgi:hypothetical protein
LVLEGISRKSISCYGSIHSSESNGVWVKLVEYGFKEWMILMGYLTVQKFLQIFKTMDN